jgi:hypothetical protein
MTPSSSISRRWVALSFVDEAFGPPNYTDWKKKFVDATSGNHQSKPKDAT